MVAKSSVRHRTIVAPRWFSCFALCWLADETRQRASSCWSFPFPQERPTFLVTSSPPTCASGRSLPKLCAFLAGRSPYCRTSHAGFSSRFCLSERLVTQAISRDRWKGSTASLINCCRKNLYQARILRSLTIAIRMSSLQRSTNPKMPPAVWNGLLSANGRTI
jgi:hypothetical protein